MEKSNLLENFKILFDVIKQLRDPNGCPWDIAQNPMTMRKALLEEAYEAVDAITENNLDHHEHIMDVREELGDVLLNVLMISYMYEQENIFSASDVINDVTQKLIRRHPHVFGKTEGYEGPESADKVSTPETVLNQWENIKDSIEKKNTKSVLDDIPKSFSPMLKALKISKKAAKTGFDWDKIENIIEKIYEEVKEFSYAVSHESMDRIEDELGDILFITINAARFLKLDPEMALLHADKKFEKRFRFIESEIKKLNIKLPVKDMELMNKLWNEAKEKEK